MSNSDWLTLGLVVLTFALVVVTTFYAWATFKILRANESMVSTMRNQQDAAMRPYIEVSMNVRTGTQILRLSVKNVGKTPALLLKLKIDKDFYQFRDHRPERNLANHPAFLNVIESFPPGSELLFDLGTGPSIYADSSNNTLCPLVFKVTAEFSLNSKVVLETSIIDLRPYIDTSIPTEPIVEELGKMRGKLEEIRKAISDNPIIVELSTVPGYAKNSTNGRIKKNSLLTRFKRPTNCR